jgi:hypothetical protein
VIPTAPPPIGDDEKRAELEALESGQLTQGSRVQAFEDTFAVHCGVRHAIAPSSGTTALHTALPAHGIGPSDEVIPTPSSDIATTATLSSTNAPRVCLASEFRGRSGSGSTASAPASTTSTRSTASPSARAWATKTTCHRPSPPAVRSSRTRCIPALCRATCRPASKPCVTSRLSTRAVKPTGRCPAHTLVHGRSALRPASNRGSP